jgi:hypothetical protein
MIDPSSASILTQGLYFLQRRFTYFNPIPARCKRCGKNFFLYGSVPKSHPAMHDQEILLCAEEGVMLVARAGTTPAIFQLSGPWQGTGCCLL